MPYKCEKLKIPRNKDNRFRFNDETLYNIRLEYSVEKRSMRFLARKYECDRKTIKRIVDEDFRLKDNEKHKVYSKYYNKEVMSKEQRNTYSHNHRARKFHLYKNADLVGQTALPKIRRNREVGVGEGENQGN